MAQINTFYIACFLVLFAYLPIQAQEKSFDTSDLVIFKSPSENYKDLLLQSHNGLPRFGTLKTYTLPNGNRDNDKFKLTAAGDENFINMIQMYYMKASYNNFNREVRASVMPVNTNQKEINSYKAQQHFQKLSGKICTVIAGNINAGANEFERRRNFKKFVSDNLDGLINWSSTLLENNAITGYWVHSVTLRNYDFDKKGYWINIPLISIKQRNSRFSTKYNFFKNYNPKNSYETKLPLNKNRNTLQPLKVLFKIAPEAAEKLQQPTKPTRGSTIANNLYIVAKVKVTLKEQKLDKNNKTPEIPEFEHHFESPIITLFKDMTLTEKVGEISLENIGKKD